MGQGTKGVGALGCDTVEAKVAGWIREAVERLKQDGTLPAHFEAEVVVERPRREEFGDFGCALPLQMARATRRPPAECARALIAAMAVPGDEVSAVEFAPPGYVNFRVRPEAWFQALKAIREEPERYGESAAGAGERVLLEFVSANPTGPLHVGHGRGAVLGDALARVMRAAGYAVETEYYVNDVGNQIATLGRSVWARGREVLGLPADFPDNGYRGEYVREVAADLARGPTRALFEQDYDAAGPADRHPLALDAANRLLGRIRADLDALGVPFDRWFSERSLYDRHLVASCVQDLLERGHAYRDESGAILFRMEGNDEDRVVVRANGVPTYFASDIAYHREKAQRGYSRLINIWGADHHGYVPRVKAALQALGLDECLLEVLLVQMVTLTRGGVVIPMGKRSGEFVTLRDVVDEVGPDAVRFLFLLRKADAQMEFDLDLAKAQTLENPVFYVQYGHARVASILRRAASLGISPPPWSRDLQDALRLPEEQAMVRDLCRFPGVVASAARRREPHHVAFYLMDLVKGFHSYYTKYKHSEKVVSPDRAKTNARLFLVFCVKAVLARGLGLLGVHAPEEMHFAGGDDDAE